MMIFGIGTGRCGTQSLSYLLNQQKNYKVGHEFLAHQQEHGPLPWEYDDALIIKRLNTLEEHGFNGDVALYYLNYVDKIMELKPGSKVVVMRRDKQSVINSFIKKTAGLDHWGDSVSSLNPWDKSFPCYGSNDKNHTIGRYYDEYYNEVLSLIEKYPNNIKIFEVESLNNNEGLMSILHFCGINQKDYVLDSKIVGSKVDGSEWGLTLHE